MALVSSLVSAYYAVDYLEGRLDNLAEQDVHPEIVVVCRAESKEHELTLRWSARSSYEDLKIVLTKDIPTVYAAWNMG